MMSLNIVYTIEASLPVLNFERIKSHVIAGEAKYKYAFPEDIDYILELEEELGVNKTVIVFKVSDAKIPPIYNYRIIHPIVLERLENIIDPQLNCREVEDVTIIEIDLNTPSV